MGFQFRLKSILMLRQRERDLQEQFVAKCQTDLEKCIVKRNELSDAKQAVYEQIRLINESAVCDVLQMIHRQRYSDQLANELVLAEAEIHRAETDLEKCRRELLTAIQSVRALEKLSERRFVEYQQTQATLLARNQESS